MRRLIAFAAAMALATLSAQAHAQSRYGPGPSTLAWPGKTPPPAAPEIVAEAAAPARPEPIAPWAHRLAAAAPAPIPAAAPASIVAEAPQYAAPTSAPTASRPAHVPTHLYDTPPAAQPAPQQQTALLGGPAARPVPASGAAEGPRFYSVYREYGIAPDAILTAPHTSRGQETTLREIPSTPSLAAPDDTQYLPARPNGEAASRRTF